MRGFLGVTALLCASVAHGAEQQHVWMNYVGAMGTFGFLDNGRASRIEEATGIDLLFGSQRDDNWGYELHVFGALNETGDDAGSDFYRWGFGGDLSYAFGPRYEFTPFILAGAGYAYNDVFPNAADEWDWFANVGAGFVTAPVGWDLFRLRGEVRGIYDDYGNQRADDAFIDYRIGLGVEFMLTPLPKSQAEAVRIVTVSSGLNDEDGDAIVDGSDQCPATPAGVRVDGTGCALPKVWRLDGVTFEFDRARLRPDSLVILQGQAETLLRYPDMKVEVAGHTDSDGSDDYNLQLSQRRADAVRDYLVSLDVPAGQITARGYGEAEPVKDNETDEGKEFNRRVELRIVDDSGTVKFGGKP